MNMSGLFPNGLPPSLTHYNGAVVPRSSFPATNSSGWGNSAGSNMNGNNTAAGGYQANAQPTPAAPQPPNETTTYGSPLSGRQIVDLGINGYKSGGRVRSRHHKMIAAHFNPEELHVLDQLQGSIERSKKDGRRSYPKLDAVLSNPHIAGNVHQHTSAHLAHGGHAGHEGMHPAEAKFGMHGDTEVAYIGPHLRHMLDNYAGHKTHNPVDGHPQYFSLSGLFSGLGNALSGGVSKIAGMLPGGLGGVVKQGLGALGGVARGALPALSQIGGEGLGDFLGNPELGPALGGVMQQLGGSALSGLGVPQQGQGSHSAESAGQGLGTAAQMHTQGGYTPQQIGGAALNTAGQNYGGTAGSAMQGFGNAYGSGQNVQNSALQGLAGGIGSWLRQRQQPMNPYQQGVEQPQMGAYQ